MNESILLSTKRIYEILHTNITDNEFKLCKNKIKKFIEIIINFYE